MISTRHFSDLNQQSATVTLPLFAKSNFFYSSIALLAMFSLGT